jgi:hypothetical protein
MPWSEGGRSSPLDRVNQQWEEPDRQWKAAAFVRWHEPYESRGSRTDLREAQGEIPWAYSATTDSARQIERAPAREPEPL